jgi:DNA-binding PadR family transcriptional regulator
VILALAESGPLKAYELLAELGRRFGPSYRPSPGAVYPALDALLGEKLLVAAQDGRGKRYSLTARGAGVLEQRRPQLVAIENRTGTRLTDGAPLRSLLERFCERVMRREGQLDLDLVEKALEIAEMKMTTRSEHAQI